MVEGWAHDPNQPINFFPRAYILEKEEPFFSVSGMLMKILHVATVPSRQVKSGKARDSETDLSRKFRREIAQNHYSGNTADQSGV